MYNIVCMFICIAIPVQRHNSDFPVHFCATKLSTTLSARTRLGTQAQKPKLGVSHVETVTVAHLQTAKGMQPRKLACAR